MKFKKLTRTVKPGELRFIILKDHKEGDIIVNGDKLIEKGVEGPDAKYPGKDFWVFESDEGEKSKLNGYAFLSVLMEDAEIGKYYQIIYKGKTGKTDNGNSHQFEVLVGEEE